MNNLQEDIKTVSRSSYGLVFSCTLLSGEPLVFSKKSLIMKEELKVTPTP